MAGVPVHSPIMLNTIKVHFIGNVLAKGERGFGGYRSGKIVRVEDSLDAELRLKHDDTEILLTRFLTPDFLPLLKGLRGIILEESSYLSPEQIRSVEPDIAAIGSVPGAMSVFEDGFTVTLHGDGVRDLRGDPQRTGQGAGQTGSSGDASALQGTGELLDELLLPGAQVAGDLHAHLHQLVAHCLSRAARASPFPAGGRSSRPGFPRGFSSSRCLPAWAR